MAKALAVAGSEEQRKHYIPALILGEKLAALASTESNSGSNSFAIITKATKDGDDFVVNGAKMFITGAGEADVYTGARSYRAGKEYADLSALIIERELRAFLSVRRTTLWDCVAL